MFFFIDNSEFKRRFPLLEIDFDYFVMGGLLCSFEEAKILEQKIAEVKRYFGIPEEMPIKWNIKDLQGIYKLSDKIDLHKNILLQADEIRLSIISCLKETNLKIIMSATPAYNREWRKNACNWAFINVLQRLGLAVSEIQQDIYPKISIIMDWPDSNDKSFFDTYSNAYHFGEPGFHSGPLKELDININLTAGVTIHSPHLQAADICVGITKDFIKWCYEGKNRQRVEKFFLPLLPYYRADNEGKILGYGLIVGKDYSLIENKISEITKIEEDDVPF